MYTKKLVLTNKRRTPFALSNHFDDTFGLVDEVTKCKNALEFCNVANKYEKYGYWTLDKEDDRHTRLATVDSFGNIHYLIGYKAKDSGLSKFTSKELKEELERRGFVVM